MLRGRKRKLPTQYIPEQYFRGSETEDGSDEEHLQPAINPDVEGQHVQHDQDLDEDEHEEDEELLRQDQDREEPEELLRQDQEREEREELLRQDQDREEPEELLRQDQDREEREDLPVQERQEAEEHANGVQDIEEEEEQPGEQQHENEPEEEEEEEEEEEDEHDQEEDEEDDEEQEVHDDDEEQDYHSILQALYEKWVVAEVDHTISQTASNDLWKIAFKFIPKLLDAKRNQQITRKIPSFNHIRKTLHKNHTPEVNMEIAYRSKATNEIEVVNSSVTPKSRFPPNLFEKMYEIASVKVRICIKVNI